MLSDESTSENGQELCRRDAVRFLPVAASCDQVQQHKEKE